MHVACMTASVLAECEEILRGQDAKIWVTLLEDNKGGWGDLAEGKPRPRVRFDMTE